MKVRAFIVEGSILKEKDVFILISTNKKNEFYFVENVVQRNAKQILLVAKITSLQMEIRIQNFRAECCVLRYLEKGKCEYVEINYESENMW